MKRKVARRTENFENLKSGNAERWGMENEKIEILKRGKAEKFERA
jgi:hypothetical protein